VVDRVAGHVEPDPDLGYGGNAGTDSLARTHWLCPWLCIVLPTWLCTVGAVVDRISPLDPIEVCQRREQLGGGLGRDSGRGDIEGETSGKASGQCLGSVQGQ